MVGERNARDCGGNERLESLTYDTEELHRHVREASEVLCRCLVNFPKCLIKTSHQVNDSKMIKLCKAISPLKFIQYLSKFYSI